MSESSSSSLPSPRTRMLLLLLLLREFRRSLLHRLKLLERHRLRMRTRVSRSIRYPTSARQISTLRFVASPRVHITTYRKSAITATMQSMASHRLRCKNDSSTRRLSFPESVPAVRVDGLNAFFAFRKRQVQPVQMTRLVDGMVRTLRGSSLGLQRTSLRLPFSE